MLANRAGSVPTARLIAPSLPTPYIPRVRLEGQLDAAMHQPVITVLAGAGYGKSTALAAWAAERRVSWYACDAEDAHLLTLLRGLTSALRTRVVRLPPELASAVRGDAGPDIDDPGRAEALAGLLAEAIDAASSDALHLVVDDAGLIPTDSGGGRLLRALVRQAPAQMRLLLVARGPLPLEAHHTPPPTLTSRELVFTSQETAALLQAVGVEDTAVAASVFTATAGWPSAVRLAAEALRGGTSAQVRSVVHRLVQPGSPLHTLLIDEVLQRIEATHRALLGTLAVLPRANPMLCRHLGIADPLPMLSALVQRGLVLDSDDGDGWYTLSPVVREAALDVVTLPLNTITQITHRAAAWFADHGQADAALELLADAGAKRELAELLAAAGPALVTAGRCAPVLRAIDALDPEQYRDDIRLVEGHARQVIGDWEGALAAFASLSSPDAALPPGIAWRMGLIHHLKGELHTAIDVYRRGIANHPPASTDHPKVDHPDHDQVELAHLLAWSATAHWLLGEVDTCRQLGEQAHTLARSSGDPGALAISHTTLALLAATEGDRRANDRHYLRALASAEEAGDVLQLLRIRCNRGSRSLEEGAYQEALVELEQALRLGEASGYVALHALSLSNRGDVRQRLGRLEEAVADYESARALYQQIDSGMIAYALLGLGDVHRVRGDLALAQAAYEEAVAASRPTGDVQALSPALAGLARVIAADDLDRARQLAEESLSHTTGLNRVIAELAVGFIALAAGDVEVARTTAEQAQQTARTRRDRAGLAEALELAALACEDPSVSIGLLDEAIEIWRTLDEPIGHARASLAAARLDPEGIRHTEASLAIRRLRSLGLRTRAVEAAGTLRHIAERRAGSIEVQVLGGFAVRRDGRPVPHAAWPSPKAQDLLMVLIARRGRPVPRDQLIATLWPDDAHEVAAQELDAVVLATQAVLDPETQRDPDTFVIADPRTVMLDLQQVEVDLEAFLASAAEGLALREQDRARSLLLLEEAETRYTGEAFEEAPDAAWTVALREEARATYITVARSLAQDARQRGDADTAMRLLLRILEHDPYDERAHHELVRALAADGRHGEARRRYRTYAARMAELSLPTEPIAALLGRP